MTWIASLSLAFLFLTFFKTYEKIHLSPTAYF